LNDLQEIKPEVREATPVLLYDPSHLEVERPGSRSILSGIAGKGCQRVRSKSSANGSFPPKADVSSVLLIDEAVVVAKSQGQAIYRSTYNEDSMRDGVPYTHQGNYIAGFKRDRDGVWRIHWSTVCWQSPSHKKEG